MAVPLGRRAHHRRHPRKPLHDDDRTRLRRRPARARLARGTDPVRAGRVTVPRGGERGEAVNTAAGPTGTAAGGTTAPAAAHDLSRAGRRLQLTRAAQWFAGNQGDPYGMILRAGTADPAPYEEEIRERGPLFHSELLGTWVTGSRHVADAVTADDAFGALTADGARPGVRELPLSGSALDAAHGNPGGPPLPGGWPHRPPDREERDDPDRHAADLLNAAGPGQVLDLVPFARRLAARTTGAWLGVPAERLPRFETALTGCRRALDALLCPQLLADARAGLAAEEALRAVLGETPEARGRPPGAVEAARAHAVSAAEPIAVLLCNAVRELMERPAQWRALTADPGLAGAAITETLLWAPPVRLESRVARETAVLAGRTLPAGTHLVVLAAAANRDACRNAGPAVTGFDVLRRASDGGPQPHGLPEDLHFRLSGPLVRRTAEAGLRALAERFPGLRPAGPAVRVRRSPVLRGLGRLPVAPYVPE
ncbi:P450-derived glycosyltransferase activator [Streptomyces xinghaiensis]|nr:P450-derived glycosyltransferase activator [Streptomyces xinghaiensis]